MNGEDETHEPAPDARDEHGGAEVVDLAARRALAPRVVEGELVTDHDADDVVDLVDAVPVDDGRGGAGSVGGVGRAPAGSPRTARSTWSPRSRPWQ